MKHDQDVIVIGTGIAGLQSDIIGLALVAGQMGSRTPGKESRLRSLCPTGSDRGMDNRGTEPAACASRRGSPGYFLSRPSRSFSVSSTGKMSLSRMSLHAMLA